MMRIALLLLGLTFAGQSLAQKELDQDFNAFLQKINVADHRNKKFRLKGFVRVEHGDKQTEASLWARVDNAKGTGFFDNMVRRRVSTDEWKECVIEGETGPKAEWLVLGGMYFGFGKYYFDNITLEFKEANGEWAPLTVPNGDFEKAEVYGTWKLLSSVKGYESSLTPEGYGSTQALVIDGLGRSALSYGNNREKGRTVEVNGIKVYYEEYGTGEPLLLLHGNAESIGSFKFQIPELSKSFKVIAMDSRGQGRSTEDGKKLTYELMAEDVNAFLDVLGLSNVNLLGWSDGGNIGLILAMKHPQKVRRLAIMGANLYNDKTSVSPKINKQVLSVREQIVRENKPESGFQLQLLDLALNEPKINPEDLKAIGCPTLVMAGSKDVIKEEHTKLIASKIVKSTLVIFDGGTHYAPQEIPQRFNKAVLDFLAKD